MRFDQNGYPILDPYAPKTRVGKIAAIFGAFVVVSIFGYGLFCLGIQFRDWLGLS